MHQVRADVPEIGDEFVGFAQVNCTKSRLAPVLVDVHVKHAGRPIQRDLQRRSDRRRAHHRSDRGIVDVCVIGDGMKFLREH